MAVAYFSRSARRLGRPPARFRLVGQYLLVAAQHPQLGCGQHRQLGDAVSGRLVKQAAGDGYVTCPRIGQPVSQPQVVAEAGQAVADALDHVDRPVADALHHVDRRVPDRVGEVVAEPGPVLIRIGAGQVQAGADGERDSHRRQAERDRVDAGQRADRAEGVGADKHRVAAGHDPVDVAHDAGLAD